MELADAVARPAPTRYTLAGGFALAVVFASMMYAPADPFARHGPLGLVGFDKWVHVGSYAGVTFLLLYAYVARSARAILTIALASVVLGAGVEVIQSTIAWRTMEAADVAANTLGTGLAVAAWQAVKPRLPSEDHQWTEERPPQRADRPQSSGD